MKSLLIIGAGPGGYECALRAAKSGLDVHVVDRAEHIGGTCLNEGCIPTKCLCHTAEVLEMAKVAQTYGVVSDATQFNIEAALERKNNVVTQLKQGIRTLLSTPGITFHDGEARFLPNDAHSVKVGDDVITADYVFIATGSVSKYLPVPGAHSEGVLTSTELLSLNEVPSRLCIIGGGVIGLEFAGIFNSFGSKVTVIEYCKEILPNFDRDIAKRLRTSLKKQGIEFITGAPVTAIHVDSTKNNEIHVSYEYRNAVHDCLADKVLMAVGRGANLSSLNLDEAGIAYTKKGITVDEHMQTNVPGVYAVGDINGLCQLAHAATFQSYCALSHVLGNADFKVDLSIVPAAVFTTPEAAMVGLTEEEAKAQNIEIKVHKAFYRANGRALAMDAGGDGLVKIIAHDDIVVGAHILGAHSSELIHEIALLMSKQGTLADIRNCIHAHPTLSELVLQAAES